MEPKEIIKNIEEKIKELKEYSSRTMGMIKYKDVSRMKEEHEEMIKKLYSAIEVFEMWPISYDVSESVKPKIQKIKLSEIKQLVRKSLKEAKELNEGNWNKIMKGVRSGDQMGPWAIVVIKNNKVIHQKLVNVRDAIPAHYEDIKKNYPDASISIEDNSGQIVYNERGLR